MILAKQTQNIFETIRPGVGGQIQVLITWNERILQTCHYPIGPKVTIGQNANINLPLGTMVRNFNLLESRNGQAFVNFPFEAKALLNSENQFQNLTVETYRLRQNEVVFISFGNNIHLAVRFVPLINAVPPSSGMLFSSSEYTTLLSALLLTTLSSLMISVLTPKVKKEEEPVYRIVDIIFEKPQFLVETKILSEEKMIIPKLENKSSNPNDAAFTSKLNYESQKKTKRVNDRLKVAQIKTQTQKLNPANSQSSEIDPTRMGLMSVLSTNGMREKIDRASNGAGELLGIGESATGSSGFNSSASGEDFGSKLKNTGQGGSGTSTMRISSLTIAGLEGSGSDTFGEKEKTGIVLGGREEGFIGTIDREAVRKAVRSQLPAIKYCFERQYKINPLLEGKIVVAWQIHAEGLAQNVKVVQAASTMNNQIVENCVQSVIESIRFPEPPEGAVVEVTGFPFLFLGVK